MAEMEPYGTVQENIPEMLEEIKEALINAIEEKRQGLIEMIADVEEKVAGLGQEITSLKEESDEIIRRLALIDGERRRARQKLAEISADPERYGESDLREAFLAVERLAAEFSSLRAREEALRRQIAELEDKFNRYLDLKEQAENFLSRLSVILQHLRRGAGEMEEAPPEKVDKKLALKMLEVQEEERRWVAREIHDGLAQIMASASLRLEYCLRLLEKKPEEVEEELRSIQELVKEGVEEARRMTYDLRPMALDELGLVPTLKRYLEEFKSFYNIDTEMIITGRERRLPAPQEAGVFRIFQEALRNVGKHASAQKVMVYLDFSPGSLELKVEDDGRGFSPEEVRQDPKRRGFGLWSMRERAKLLGGELEITSTPGQGTTVKVAIPLAEEEEDGKDPRPYSE